MSDWTSSALACSTMILGPLPPSPLSSRCWQLLLQVLATRTLMYGTIPPVDCHLSCLVRSACLVSELPGWHRRCTVY